MRVLVCGGRDYNNRKYLFSVLNKIHSKKLITTLISGGARGADSLGAEWAKENNVKLLIYYAEWDIFGKRAGIIRNTQMLDKGKPKLVVAFPGGRGTSHMIDISKEAKVKVIELTK